jgi:hypothetical protein
MGLDLAKAHGWIADELAELRSIEDSMRHVIDLCASAAPHRDWQRLRSLQYDDLGPLMDWIEEALRTEPPEVTLRGLWFGISNPIRGDGPTADFYICGSERFGSDPESNEWACRPAWRPESRYAHSEVMAAIYAVAYKPGGLGNDAEYPLCLAYTAFAVRDLLNSADTRLVLRTVGPVGVAVGFDSGDFLLLGRYTRDGLARL